MSNISINFHDVDLIKITKIDQLKGTGTYILNIIIKSNDLRSEIVCFSNNKKNLKVKNNGK